MTTFETPLVLLVIAGVMAAALAFWNTHDRREIRDLSAIAEIARQIPFDLSCAPDGRLDDRRAANCFERKDYRFIRDGAGTAIARVGTGSQTELIYHFDMTQTFGSLRALGEARAALEYSLKDQQPSQRQ